MKIKLIDKFPDWDLDLGDENEILYNLKQQIIEKIHTINKNFPQIDALEKKFFKSFSEKHFQSDAEYYKLFIDYIESQLKEIKPRPSKREKLSKPDKELVKKVKPHKFKESVQGQDSSLPSKKSTMKTYLEYCLKSGIFAISFMAPTVLFILILVVILDWNYLAVLRYQPVFFLLLIIIMILVGILSGWISLFLTKRYQCNRIDRLDRREYLKLKREFNEKVPLGEFEKGKDGKTITQWYQQFEKFLESKKKDN